MRSLIIVSLLLFTVKAFAWQNDMSLKAGLGIAQANIHAFDSSEDHMTGFGFNTQFAYRFTNWELNLSSYIFWGSIDDLRFTANNASLFGSGTYRSVSFGPMAKYIFNSMPYRNWHPYIGAGYAYSIQTVKLLEFQLLSGNGNFNSNYKLTYISRGPMISIGLEEILPFKEMHPVFIELLYSYTKSKRITVVDASDFTEVNTISTEESSQLIRGNFIMINAGITLF